MGLHPELWAVIDPLERDQALRVLTQLGHLQGGNALHGGSLDQLTAYLRDVVATRKAETVDGAVWAAIAAVHERWCDASAGPG